MRAIRAVYHFSRATETARTVRADTVLGTALAHANVCSSTCDHHSIIVAKAIGWDHRENKPKRPWGYSFVGRDLSWNKRLTM